ncbi:hypothetical protein CJU89_6699 [Yarrowia sp. B02]|nr:hypothetical protein CJU89_6699 [Yarrowia sp. B02]
MPHTVLYSYGFVSDQVTQAIVSVSLFAALFCMTPIALFFLIDISAFMYQSMKKQMGVLSKATVPHVA